MPKEKSSHASVLINEWDGDRSSAPGGFTLVVKSAGLNLRRSMGSYETLIQRFALLEKARKKGRKIANELGIELEERLFT